MRGKAYGSFSIVRRRHTGRLIIYRWGDNVCRSAGALPRGKARIRQKPLRLRRYRPADINRRSASAPRSQHPEP